MNRKLDFRTKMALIDDGSLILKAKIELEYGLDLSDVDMAVRRDDLSSPVEYVYKEYYYTDELEMLAAALAESGV